MAEKTNGTWKVKGKRVDPYRLMVWLQSRYDHTGEKVYPSQATPDLVEQAVAQNYRYH